MPEEHPAARFVWFPGDVIIVKAGEPIPDLAGQGPRKIMGPPANEVTCGRCGRRSTDDPAPPAPWYAEGPDAPWACAECFGREGYVKAD